MGWQVFLILAGCVQYFSFEKDHICTFESDVEACYLAYDQTRETSDRLSWKLCVRWKSMRMHWECITGSSQMSARNRTLINSHSYLARALGRSVQDSCILSCRGPVWGHRRRRGTGTKYYRSRWKKLSFRDSKKHESWLSYSYLSFQSPLRENK